MKQYILLLLQCLTIASCTTKTNNLSEITTFPIDVDVNLSSLNIGDKLVDPSRIECFDDLFIVKDKGTNGELATYLQINNPTCLYTLVNKGRASNELLSAWCFTRKDSLNNFWIFDVVTADVLKININNNNPTIKEKLSLSRESANSSSVDLLNDSEFLCVGRFDNSRVLKVDTSGKISSTVDNR